MKKRIKRSSTGFYSVELKVANMPNTQNFMVCSGVLGDCEATLQSAKRFISLNILDGKAVINKSNKNYPNRHDLVTGITFDFDKDLVSELLEYREIADRNSKVCFTGVPYKSKVPLNFSSLEEFSNGRE